MSGTKDGGIRAAEEVIRRYGLTEDGKSVAHVRAGRKGGEAHNRGGFLYMKEHGQVDKIREAGRKGGQISRRPK